MGAGGEGLARLYVSICLQLSVRFLLGISLLTLPVREDAFCQSSPIYAEGVSHLANKQYDQAEKSFLEALKDPKAPVEAYYQLAWVYLAKGQWGMAEDSVS